MALNALEGKASLWIHTRGKRKIYGVAYEKERSDIVLDEN